MSTKKKVVEDNTRKVAVKSKGMTHTHIYIYILIQIKKQKDSQNVHYLLGFTTFNNKITVPESPHFQSTKVANRHRAIVDTGIFLIFVLFCFVLFCFVLFCFVLFCFVLFCFVLFWYPPN